MQSHNRISIHFTRLLVSGNPSDTVRGKTRARSSITYLLSNRALDPTQVRNLRFELKYGLPELVLPRLNRVQLTTRLLSEIDHVELRSYRLHRGDAAPAPVEAPPYEPETEPAPEPSQPAPQQEQSTVDPETQASSLVKAAGPGLPFCEVCAAKNN